MSQLTKQIPVYKQFQREVRQKILDGLWLPGQRLPSERELQSIYSISRLTINKSLNQLADEGLLMRYQGKGTFVADNKANGRETVAPAMPTNQNITIKYLAPGRNGSPASPIRLGVLEGMHQQLDPMGFSSAVDFFNNPEQHEAAIRRLPDTSSAAAIWNEPYISNDALDYLKKRKFPFVLLDSYPKDFELDYVVGDNTSGGRMMVEHLVSLGHSKIVYITAATSRTSLRDRKAGFIQGAVEAGIEVSNRSIYTLSCQNAEDGKDDIPGVLKEILARPDKPTAICLSNDILSLTAIQWLNEQGIKVPTDLSIVGYDNIDLGEYSTVPLTTVGQHWMELGRSAADVLYQKLQNPKMRRHLQIMVKPTFVIRKSAAKPFR